MLQIIWNVDPRIFPPWEFPRWYGLLWAIGVMIGLYVMEYFYKKEDKSLKEFQALSIYILLGIIIGARLGHVLFYEPLYYWQNPIEILPIRLEPHFQFTGLQGLASHGGVIGIIISLLLFCRKYKEDPFWILDRLVIAGTLTGSCIRLGNLMNSEIIGIPTEVPWAFIFSRVDNLPRHPAQLYEAIYCWLLFFLLFYLWKHKRNQLHPGFLLGLLLTILFSLRFIDEFFKIDQVAFESQLWLNMGQLLSIPFILVGIYLLIVRSSVKKP